jgi:stearoyl-CoA desaturase (delta-9 desaturase)
MIRNSERTTSPVDAVIHFFDTWARRDDAQAHPEPDRVDWIRTLPFVLMHVACVAVIWVGWSPVAVWTAVALYFVRMFAITGFYHRYFSHRTFRTSRAAQFLFALLGATAVQRGPLWWAAHHRHHHKYSDQVEDIHSPVQAGFFRSHMGWLMTPKNFPTQLHLVKDLAKFPELCFLDRFDTLIPIALATAMFGLGALLEAVAPGLGTNGWQMLVWGFFISTVVLFHGTCTINSLSHVFGTRPYKTTDTSRNNFLLALITMGEGWHNNHHYYQGSVRQGFRWWQVDATYYILRTMSLFGIVWKLNPVPAELQRPASEQPPTQQ